MTVTIKRAQMSSRVSGVDITVKSAIGFARRFAPTWNMVMGYKNKSVTETQYSVQYRRILDNVPPEAWTWLGKQAVNGVLTVKCFCRDGQFCHTYLLAAYMAERWPDLYKDGTHE